jgi:hypothetical protein
MGVAILRVPEGFCVDEDENDNDFQKPEEDTKLIGIFLLSFNTRYENCSLIIL